MADSTNINDTFGAALMGLVIGSVLYGLTLMQTYVYFRTYPNDLRSLKLTVFTLWALDTAHLILSTTAVYWYLVLNFNNTSNLDVGYWAMDIQTDCNGLIGLIVELFFARRVWKVSKSPWLSGLICILSFLHFTLGIYFTIEGFVLGHFSRYSKLVWATSLGLGSAAACDITIAASLVYYLLKNRTGFERSDSIITTLVVYAINTGLFTSVCALTATICFGLMPTNFIWLGFFWCLGKLYVNSLLASLNSRKALRGIAEEGDIPLQKSMRTQTTSFTSRRVSKGHYPPNNIIPGPFSPIAVVVDTVTEQSSDYEGSTNAKYGSNARPFSSDYKL